MAQDPKQVVVAGNGDIWVAAEGTPPPVDLAALASPWTNLGYASEDGVTFTLDRDVEDIMAWQSMEPVRVLVTGEPKTIATELLQWSAATVAVALQGGTITPGVDPAPDKYEPPAAGTMPVRALTVDAIDGPKKYRYFFPRVQVAGSVEWNLQRADAIRLPLEFRVLAATPGWFFLYDDPDFGTAPAGLLALPEAELATAGSRSKS